MKKILFVVIDGMGGNPVEAVGNRTALAAASTPNMDRLAREGETGLMYPVAKGVAPESDVAVLSILGYDVNRYYTGRGPLEAFGAGLEVSAGDLAWRGNFATVVGQRIVDRRVGRSLTDAEAAGLSAEIGKEVILPGATFEFKATVGHRCVLVIHPIHGVLSGEVDNTDPGYVRRGPYSVAIPDPPNTLQPCRPLVDTPEAKASASLTNGFIDAIRLVLENSSINATRRDQGKLVANMILLRDAGDRLPSLPSLKSKFGMQFGSLVEMPVERALASLTGMQEIVVPDVQGRRDLDYPRQARAVLAALPTCDGAYVHLKDPGIYGHDGDAPGKVAAIEDIDRCLFGQLLPALNLDDFVIAVTADHCTPVALEAHSADPVPLLIRTSGLRPDGSETFDEEVCSRGALSTILGPDLLVKLVALANQ